MMMFLSWNNIVNNWLTTRKNSLLDLVALDLDEEDDLIILQAMLEKLQFECSHKVKRLLAHPEFCHHTCCVWQGNQAPEA